MKQNAINIKNHIYSISGDNFIKVVKETQQKPMKLRQAFLSIFDVDTLKRQNPKVSEYTTIINDVERLLKGLGLYDDVKSNRSNGMNRLKEIFYSFSERVLEECGIDISIFSDKDNFKKNYRKFQREYSVLINKKFLTDDELVLFKRIINIKTDLDKQSCLNSISDKYPTFAVEYSSTLAKSSKKHKEHDFQVILTVFKKIVKCSRLSVDFTKGGDIQKKTKPYIDYISILGHRFYKSKSSFIEIFDTEDEDKYLSYSKAKNNLIKDTQKKYGDHIERNVYKLIDGKIDFSDKKNLYKFTYELRKQKSTSEYSGLDGSTHLHHPVPQNVNGNIADNPLNNIYVTQTEHYDLFHMGNKTKKVSYKYLIEGLKSAHQALTSLKDQFEDVELFDKYVKECEDEMISILYSEYSGPKSYIKLLESEDITLDHKNIVRI